MIGRMKLAALAASALAFAFSPPSYAADKPVFGLVMSFSGWFQPIDADTIAGAKLAVDEINAAGGVLGQPIELVQFDNKSEPPLGADGAVDVIGRGAKATNELNFATQKFARVALGTNNVDSCNRT